MAHPSRQPWRRSADGLVLRFRLTPRSSENTIDGVERFDVESVIKARVRAAPEKGKANKALLKLDGDWLGVPVSSLSLASGSKSRLKSVAVEGVPADLISIVSARLAEETQ